MKTVAYYEITEKKLKVDVTDIISFKNDLKFELKIKEKSKKKTIKEYELIEVCENEEYSFYLVFDFKNVCFENLINVRLNQFKNNLFANNKIVYYSLKII